MQNHHSTGNHSDYKNIIIAIILSVAVMAAWKIWVIDPQIAEQAQIEQDRQQGLQENGSLSDDESNPHLAEIKSSTSNGNKSNLSNQSIISRNQALASREAIKIVSDKIRGSINLQGARFDDLVLRDYYTDLESKNNQDVNNEIILLSPSRTRNSYFADFNWISQDKNINLPNSNTIWQSNSQQLKAGEGITLYWENGQSLRFELDIELDDEYMFSVTQRVINNSNNNHQLYPYGRVNRLMSNLPVSMLIMHEGPIGMFAGKLEEIDYEDMLEEKQSRFETNSGWLGIGDKYWLTAIAPASTAQGVNDISNMENDYNSANNIDIESQDNPDSNIIENNNFVSYFRASEQPNGMKKFQTDFRANALYAYAGESVEYKSYFFAGPKKVSLLDKYQQNLNIDKFDHSVDFGVLYFLTKPTFYALHYLNDLTGNFGIAILIFTVFVKILLFPLANKSYHSMAMMRTLEPKLRAIKERCGDDRMKMNQEVMALYQKEKINPVSGCLPILLQIPIFFALYKVLFVTIEMRHAPFYGWVNDLSAMDPTNLFTLFGLIAWNPPAFLHIGIWPIIMAVTMVIQQRLSPPPSDPMQAKIMKLLPLFFLFMFASFPAGLVIYWAWNNSLSILQQWWITRKLQQKGFKVGRVKENKDNNKDKDKKALEKEEQKKTDK